MLIMMMHIYIECYHDVNHDGTTNTVMRESYITLSYLMILLCSANYIKVPSNQPITTEFQSWLDTMVTAGVIAQWSGIFQDYHINSQEFSRSNDEVRYVGYPSMSSICRHLVNEVKISTAFSQRIKAHYGMNRRWKIIDEATDKVILDEVDWLISTDQ